MKNVWSKICDIFAWLILCGHISSTLMAVARKTAGGRSNSWKPLWERNFWPALGNHVPGTWHQTELLPIFQRVQNSQNSSLKTWTWKLLGVELFETAGCRMRQNYCQNVCWLQKPRKVFCAKLIQIGKAAQTIWILIRSKRQAVQITRPKSEAVCFWDESKYAVGKSQPSKEELDLRFNCKNAFHCECTQKSGISQ